MSRPPNTDANATYAVQPEHREPPPPARPGIVRFCLLAVLMLGLPVAGLWQAGYHLAPYFAMPPRTFIEPMRMTHAQWSDLGHNLWDNLFETSHGNRRSGFIAVWLLVSLVVLLLSPLVVAGLNLLRQIWRTRRAPSPVVRPYPGWGWAALAWTAVWWCIAWNRLPWLAYVQPHTYLPLWLGYIATVNAWSWRRGGRALLVTAPRRLAGLFVLSAGFWWFFEYLNRFVQNWVYVGVSGYGVVGYVVLATLAFSTVLPAVVGTHDLLRTWAPLRDGFTHMWRWRLWWPLGRLFALVVLLLAAGSLFVVGRDGWREIFFPALWVAPLLLVASSNALLGRRHFFQGLREGDWRPIITWALAALVCGGFWEMWNWHSQAKWLYQVPFVDFLHVFEMPLLGFLGYLPFGWECGIVASWLLYHRAPSRVAEDRPAEVPPAPGAATATAHGDTQDLERPSTSALSKDTGHAGG